MCAAVREQGAFEGSQFWIRPGQRHAPPGKARIDIAQYADGTLELLYRGQPLAYRSHVLHEHLQQHKLADDKTVNQRVDDLTKKQRRQLTLRAHFRSGAARTGLGREPVACAGCRAFHAHL